MTEAELIAGFVRVRKTPSRVFVEVLLVESVEADPTTRWSLAALLPKTAIALDIDRAIQRTLADYRWFARCDGCGERMPKGAVQRREDLDVCSECIRE